MSQDATKTKLTARMVTVLECLANRQDGETVEEVGHRAGVSRKTVYRYWQIPEFRAAFKKQIEASLGMHRGRMANALVAGGTSSGPGQASMQRIYWQLLGELKNQGQEDPLESLGGVTIIVSEKRVESESESEGESSNSRRDYK